MFVLLCGFGDFLEEVGRERMRAGGVCIKFSCMLSCYLETWGFSHI